MRERTAYLRKRAQAEYDELRDVEKAIIGVLRKGPLSLPGITKDLGGILDLDEVAVNLKLMKSRGLVGYWTCDRWRLTKKSANIVRFFWGFARGSSQ